jgi:hypothetical protein
MDRHPHYPPHYHIRWAEKDTLDWECFSTQWEADLRAAELAGADEIFTIEEVFANCPLRAAKSAEPRDTAQGERTVPERPTGPRKPLQ